MRGLTARVDTQWIAFTPLSAHTLTAAREVAFGADGPYAAAAVGVYGSGKSTLLFTLLREALALGLAPVWDEAAALVERVLPGDEAVSPQVFVARVRQWLDDVRDEGPARAAFFAELSRRGRADVAARLGEQRSGADTSVVLLLDEVEQAHQLLLRRIATDDGQPLRALIDACGPNLRLLLAYAPESYHTVGDADRGRLVTLPVPAVDVASIQQLYGIDRGHANFAWWVSRGRARGVEQAVRAVIEPLRAGLFDHDLTALGDALDALPGVFGVPALLRDGLDHRGLRALLDLRPQPVETAVGGVVCRLGDRRRLADRIRHELARRLGDHSDLGAVANEVVAVLEATADAEDRVYLTLDDFSAVLRVAEARTIECGRMREPIDRLADEGARIFDALGELGALEHRLPFALRALCDERFPSPFTDPYLPLADGHVPGDAELERRFRALATQPGPALVSSAGGFAVFANAERLARHFADTAADAHAEPLRALLLEGSSATSPLLELATFAGRLAAVEVGRFHATFLKCLALRTHERGGGRDMDALAVDGAGDRQLGRKIAWHRDRLLVQVRDLRPRADPDWQAAVAFVRQHESFRGTLARLDRDSPALLGLLFALRPLGASERALCARTVGLLGEGTPLRRLAREANPGGRLSGAAVVLDGLVPAGGRQPRWTEQPGSGAHDLARVLDRFAASASLRGPLASWLFREDRARLETLLQYHGGTLPDLERELDALAALRRLDDTARRALAVVANLERCTGRRHATLTALRLGNFIDHVRQQAGPVELLRQLAAEVAALPATGATAWVRALLLWLCGVIAARLLKGVEKEQATLSEWERFASHGADLGRHADDVQTGLAEAGAQRCVELLRHRRAQLANALDSASGAARALDELRAVVTALAPAAPALATARAALQAAGVAIDEDLESYLPEPDAVTPHVALLRRVPEMLAELGEGAPRPSGRGLGAYLEQLRRHAETTRQQRLRLRLDDLLGLALEADVRVNGDEVAAIEQAWARLDAANQACLRTAMTAAVVRGSDELQRWVIDCADKRELVAAWPRPEHPAMAALDAKGVAWSQSLHVSPDEVREMTRMRARAGAALHNLRTGLLAPTVLEALVAAAKVVDGGRVYAQLVEEARAFDERLAALRERYARTTGAYPSGPLPASTPDEALRALEAQCVSQHAALEEALGRLRAVGDALAEVDARGTPIPAEISLLGAERLLERETLRLREALSRQAGRLSTWLQGVGLPATLAPTASDELTQWRAALQLARTQAEALHGQLATARQLGVVLDLAGADSWDVVAARCSERLAAALAEQSALQRRYDELRERATRLGSDATGEALPARTLQEARQRHDGAAHEVERLRRLRLSAASAAARAAYQAILDGDGAALPAAIAELVALGLIRTVEEPT